MSRKDRTVDVAPAQGCSVMVRYTRLGEQIFSQAHEALKARQKVLKLIGTPPNAFLLTIAW